MKKLIPAALLVCVLGAAVLLWVDSYFNVGNSQKETSIVIIEKGDGVKTIARKLEHAEVIDYPQIFLLIARISGETNLKQGEYEFVGGISPAQVLDKLARGDVKIRKFTIPEGKTSYEVAEILKATEGLQGTIPQITEGSILSSTYHYHYKDSYEDVIKKMETEMQETITELWEKRAPNLPIKTPQEAIILASIVERETGVDEERGLVASVFINRLNKGMRLESDPTAVYGITLGKPLGRPPTSKDIDTHSPFNTYTIDRLPPTPICNIGKKSLEAVLNPPQTDYLFFVANGNGGHNFSATLSGHNENIKKYRAALAAIKN